MSRDEHLFALRSMLAGFFDAHFSGAAGASHARAQGLVDGYMRALVDLRVSTDDDLLRVVQQEREAASHRADAHYSRQASVAPRVAAQVA